MTLAKADCALCAMMGYRSCDECGNPIMPTGDPGAFPTTNSFGRELCVYCA
jgi:hypothetical protein